MSSLFKKYKKSIHHFYKSIWFFPAILTIILLTLTAFKISGSSIGVYNEYFYGNSKDTNLLLNNPQNIRSDEWIVNTQMAIAQSNNNFERVNDNIGYGQDMSIMTEAPTKDLFTVFRPQNLAFFVLPFDNAFAFKWWFIGYLLILSLYFLILQFMPKKRLLSALIATSAFFSPFIQWWYLYGTLATVYHSFFAALLLVLVIKAKTTKSKLLWSFLFFYNFACFLLVLYPPFQIPALLVVLLFTIGYLLDYYRSSNFKSLLVNFSYVFGASLLAILVFGVFYLTRSSVFEAINNTAYPGERVIASGGFDIYHFFSSNLAFLQQFTRFSNNYQIAGSTTNPSESSNFVLLLPFLIIPLLFTLWKSRKVKDHHRLTTISMIVCFAILVGWLFIPNLGTLGSLLLLDKVPLNRLLVGLGILGYFCLILLIHCVDQYKKSATKQYQAIIYSIACFLFILLISIKIADSLPLFVTFKKALVLAVPIPVILYLTLTRRFVLASLGLLSFSIFSTYAINPLYRGTDIIQNHPLANIIQTYSDEDEESRWVTDESALENFISANGAKSLTGVFAYPQKDIWNKFEDDENIYNRYAHTNYVFDRNPNLEKPSDLLLVGEDNFGIITEPCGAFIKDNDVRFIITRVKFDKDENCTVLDQTISYPEKQFYIYRIEF